MKPEYAALRRLSDRLPYSDEAMAVSDLLDRMEETEAEMEKVHVEGLPYRRETHDYDLALLTRAIDDRFGDAIVILYEGMNSALDTNDRTAASASLKEAVNRASETLVRIDGYIDKRREVEESWRNQDKTLAFLLKIENRKRLSNNARKSLKEIHLYFDRIKEHLNGIKEMTASV